MNTTMKNHKNYSIPVLLIFLQLFLWQGVSAQKADNIFIITLDGLRWQEVFSGADSLLVNDSGYTDDPKMLADEFWDKNPKTRREKLMPFFWQTIAAEGQLHGNRKQGSKVNCTNKMWFSYPGYSEILCGFADDEKIMSNNKIDNPNVTVLEYLNKRKDFTGRVAAFASWDVFSFIINSKRSGIPVNDGFKKAEGDLTEIESFLNKIQDEIRGPWETVRLDVFTHHYSLEYIRKEKPRVVYLAYGETDDWAHEGDYDQYLYSARQTDAYIKELWEYVQSDSFYKNKTALIITTDHGRGTIPKDQWRSHGSDVPGGGQTWVAAIGTGVPSLGEVNGEEQLFQNQIAKTAATLLGVDYNQPKAGAKIDVMIK